MSKRLNILGGIEVILKIAPYANIYAIDLMTILLEVAILFKNSLMVLIQIIIFHVKLIHVNNIIKIL